jgi:hypothetical protein
LVAVLIIVNFLLNVAEAQLTDRPSEKTAEIFKTGEIGFTVVFSLELLMNLGSSRSCFWTSAWNWFDLIIVISSITTLAMEGVSLPGLAQVKAWVRIV